MTAKEERLVQWIEALGFFEAKSEFYPDLDRFCCQRVIEAFPVHSDEDEG